MDITVKLRLSQWGMVCQCEFFPVLCQILSEHYTMCHTQTQEAYYLSVGDNN